MQCKAYDPIAQGINDPLNIRALAFEEESIAVVLVFDLCGIHQIMCADIRNYITEKTGLDYKNIFISATHAHTSLRWLPDSENRQRLRLLHGRHLHGRPSR